MDALKTLGRNVMPHESNTAFTRWEQSRSQLARLESLCAAAIILHARGDGPPPDDIQEEVALLRRNTDLLYEEALKSVKLRE